MRDFFKDDGTVVYFDRGGGYMTMHFSKLIKLYNKKEEFCCKLKNKFFKVSKCSSPDWISPL